MSTVTYFSITAWRFSLQFGSEQKLSNCLAFLYPVLELLKFCLTSTDPHKAVAYKKNTFRNFHRFSELVFINQLFVLFALDWN